MDGFDEEGFTATRREPFDEGGENITDTVGAARDWT